MRCNVGVNPLYLTDQHLVAEYRELLMVYGNLRINDFKIKTPIPKEFTLKTGHLNFFKDKFLYLEKRWNYIVEELKNRNFKTNLIFPDYKHIPDYLKQDWRPLEKDFDLIKNRIIEKLKIKPSWYRYYGKNIDLKFIDEFFKKEIFIV